MEVVGLASRATRLRNIERYCGIVNGPLNTTDTIVAQIPKCIEMGLIRDVTRSEYIVYLKPQGVHWDTRSPASGHKPREKHQQKDPARLDVLSQPR